MAVDAPHERQRGRAGREARVPLLKEAQDRASTNLALRVKGGSEGRRISEMSLDPSPGESLQPGHLTPMP